MKRLKNCKNVSTSYEENPYGIKQKNSEMENIYKHDLKYYLKLL